MDLYPKGFLHYACRIRPRMGPRPIRLLVRQRLTKPLTGAGRGSGSPEVGTETRAQALRGAAVAQTLQYTKV